VKITQIRSTIGQSKAHHGTIRALGLGKIGRSVKRPDDEVVRGLVAKVDHLVKVGNDG
jgi:large subunit ribosomal protein L30